jgi:3-oxoacyl-(acyl-carrier-protein) synthase
LNLKCDFPVSKFNFKCNLYRYTAGAVEAAFVALALSTGSVPPTLNLTNPDPAVVPEGANFVPLVAQRIPGLRAALTNSFGGGVCGVYSC